MNIEQVREYTLSLPGVTEDQPFGDDNMAVLYITNGTARFCSFSEPERKVNF